MISIIIPTYNHAHFIPIQLASLIRQGHTVSKIIVVNDGSTDETAGLLATLQSNEPRLLCINLPHNVGQLNAASIGLRYVETEFFAFAAADDFLLPGWAETSLHALQSAPNVSLCISRTFVINEASGNITKVVTPRALRGKVLIPKAFHESLVRYGTWFSSNTVLYRRKAFDESLLQLSAAGAFSDGLSISVLGLRDGVTILDEPLGVFLVRKTSISGATSTPHIGIGHLNALAAILLRSNHASIFSRRLVSRMIRRNTYIYLIGAFAELTLQYARFSIEHLPRFASTVLRSFLWLGLPIFKIAAFLSLRPFDLLLVGERTSVPATLEEQIYISDYQKALDYSPFAASELLNESSGN